MIDFISLALTCAPNIDPDTLSSIVSVESSYNPYAIGIVGAYLEKQPTTKEEALIAAQFLLKENYNFSVGLAQINKKNFKKYDLTIEKAFDPCQNLKVGGLILEECYQRARKNSTDDQEALLKAFSCYYSGNFTRGFKPDGKNGSSYVQRVLNTNNPKNSKIQITINDKKNDKNISADNVEINDINPLNSENNGTLVF